MEFLYRLLTLLLLLFAYLALFQARVVTEQKYGREGKEKTYLMSLSSPSSVTSPSSISSPWTMAMLCL